MSLRRLGRGHGSWRCRLSGSDPPPRLSLARDHQLTRPDERRRYRGSGRGRSRRTPLMEADLARMRLVPWKKASRLALGFTQEEFANSPPVITPVGTLRDWEQGRTEPDQPARAGCTRCRARPRRQVNSEIRRAW